MFADQRVVLSSGAINDNIYIQQLKTIFFSDI